MGYVEDTIGTNEKIVYTVKFHWIYTFSAFLYLLFLGVFIIGIICVMSPIDDNLMIQIDFNELMGLGII